MHYVPVDLFDLHFDATLALDDLVLFLEAVNSVGLQELRNRFAALREGGLRVTRRNSISAAMEAAE